MLQRLFLAGKYKEVLDNTGKYLIDSADPEFYEITAFQLGSLVFLGDLHEAKILFTKASDSSCPDAFRIHCQFYLGIGHVRYSQFKEAEKLFSHNLLLIRNKQVDKVSLFHALQGAAFFKLNRGQFLQCESYAHEAYLAAFEEKYPYGQVLALELLAISHCQMGKIRLGLHEFEKSLKLVSMIGNGGIETALKVSLIRYSALYGIDMQGSEDEIRKALKELNPQDTYSQADLALELARQLMLRGKTSEAQTLLDQTCELIYKHQNKRQTALFNHRYAHVLFLKGETRGALTLLRTAVTTIDAQFDAVIFRQFQGFMNHIMNAQDSFKNAINLPDARIRRRSARGFNYEIIKGEDPLGDLIDSLSQNGHLKLAELKRLGMNGLIPRALGLSPASTQIILGPDRGQLILMKSGDVVCIDSGLTSPMKRLLQLLQGQDFRDKEYLIRHTWGYEYDPLPHDKLLYTTIAKLRGLLGSFSALLEWSPVGYRLAPDVRLLDPFNNAVTHSSPEITLTKGRDKKSRKNFQQLNVRQLKALKLIEKGDALDVSSYAMKFKTSKMTACRDLTSLALTGMVFKVGKARGTKYIGEKFL